MCSNFVLKHFTCSFFLRPPILRNKNLFKKNCTICIPPKITPENSTKICQKISMFLYQCTKKSPYDMMTTQFTYPIHFRWSMYMFKSVQKIGSILPIWIWNLFLFFKEIFEQISGTTMLLFRRRKKITHHFYPKY